MAGRRGRRHDRCGRPDRRSRLDRRRRHRRRHHFLKTRIAATSVSRLLLLLLESSEGRVHKIGNPIILRTHHPSSDEITKFPTPRSSKPTQNIPQNTSNSLKAAMTTRPQTQNIPASQGSHLLNPQSP